MRLPLMLVAALSSAAVFVTGCGPNCQSTCNRLYQEDECNLQTNGRTRDELLQDCLQSCNNAMEVEGDVGTYSPNEYQPSSDPVTLRNDKQAALWMECVASTDCCLLGKSSSRECTGAEGGYCAPVW